MVKCKHFNKVNVLVSLLFSLFFINTVYAVNVKETLTSSTAGKSSERKTERPNFLWLVSEDNAKHYLKLYNNKGASMPAIEALAKQGLIFNNAFSNSPVCSTARTTLAIGAYNTRLAVNYHRPYQRMNLPESLKPLSKYLKDAGYYTTNNYKEDYNFESPINFWHQSNSTAHWRGRAEDQPFFHMQSWNTTHEHKLHFPATDVTEKLTIHDPKKVDLAPIYPDTDLFRYTHARYLDLHVKLDREIAQVIEQLAEDGELENTFIFYFGDHGGALPGSKGYAFERGLNVPLIVRIPTNFRHLVHKDMQYPKNTYVDGFVSFIDFAPTVLSLAGIDKSVEHDGQAFLSKNISLPALNSRDTTFGFADRFDEKYDMVRTVRRGKFKYIRNYMPFNPDSLFAEYRYKQSAFSQWKKMFEQGELNITQASFFKAKPVEGLYDISQDFYETNNLADKKEYREVLLSLRGELKNKLMLMPDLGFFPESFLVSNKNLIPKPFIQKNKTEIHQLIAIADLALLPFDQAKNKLLAALNAKQAWRRYWAMNVAIGFGEQAKELSAKIKNIAFSDEHIINRGRAIQFLALIIQRNPVSDFTSLINKAPTVIDVLYLLNMATQLHDIKGYRFDIDLLAKWNKPLGKDLITKKDMNNRLYWLKARIDYLK